MKFHIRRQIDLRIIKCCYILDRRHKDPLCFLYAYRPFQLETDELAVYDQEENSVFLYHPGTDYFGKGFDLPTAYDL